MSAKGLLTVAEYTGLVEEYQLTQSNEAFEMLHEAIKPVITSVTNSKLQQVYGQGYDENDFHSEAYNVLWRTALEFDGSRGSSFVSYFKQHLKWGINDNVIKHYSTVARKSERTAASFQNLGTADGEGGETNANWDGKLTTAVSNLNSKPIYSDIADFNSSHTLIDILSEYRNVGIPDDVFIVLEIVHYILRGEVSDPDSKHVNEMLNGKFPDLSAASVRKKKERALARFRDYCLENGMTEDLQNIEEYCHVN